MRVVLTPAEPSSPVLTLTDIRSVVLGSNGHGYPMDALTVTFLHGDVLTNPLATYARVDVLPDTPSETP